MWTENEISVLYSKYPTTPNEEISKSLDRSVSSVRCKANRLNIYKSKNYRKLVSVEKSDSLSLDNINDYERGFIMGFVSGEGTFSVKNENNRESKRFSMSIELTRSDEDVLYQIKQILGCGEIYKTSKRENNKRGGIKLSVQDFGDIVKRIIPLFDNSNFLSANKEKQFDEWKNEIYNEVPELNNRKI